MRNHLPNRASVLLAVVAAFIAFGGVSAAATRYLITSKTQIAPAVLRQLSRPGPTGPRGKTGATGAVGAAGTSNQGILTVVNGPTVTFGADDLGESIASCPPEDTVVSGGFQENTGGNQVADGGVNDDGPSGTSNWVVQIGAIQVGTGWTSGSFYAQAICAS